MSEQVAVEPGAEVAPPAVPKTESELLAEELLADRKKFLESRIGRASKREIMWFGDIHDCDRHNFYSMAEGDQRVKWDEYVQAKLDAGKARELAIKKDLLEMGYEPMLAGEVVEIKDERGAVLARGRTDLSLARQTSRRTIPVEVKCMQPHMWEAVNTWRDLLRNPWTRKYVRQLMLYTHGKGLTEGLFLLDDFQGHWKLLPVHVDPEFIAETVGKIQRAKRAVASGEAPERIPYSHSLCGRCPFAAVCIPDIGAVPATKIENNPNLAALLERRDELIDKWREVEQIDRKIKAFFEDVKEGVFTVGNFIVTRVRGERKAYEIPDEVKQKYATKVETFKNQIERFLKPDPETIKLSTRREFSFEDEVI